jgi:hypothetical protein
MIVDIGGGTTEIGIALAELFDKSVKLLVMYSQRYCLLYAKH